MRGSVVLSERSVDGVDIYRPALTHARDTLARGCVVQADIRSLPYRTGSYDVCVALDVIEHFSADDAQIVVGELERVASRRVCLMTPSGFVEQLPTDDEPWQEHKSGFQAADLERWGYRVQGVGGLRFLRRGYAQVKYGPVGAAVAVATAGMLRRAPQFSYHLFAVKDLS